MSGSLATGTRLGPYEILSPLGAGGMGEVYLARDTRLDRTVAVKVLPSDLAADPERRARFEREGRAVSSLNHPHICTLYDVGHADAAQGPIDYLVMEYVEGETLADRLVKGALSLDLVLRYGTEIADALDNAHRQGVVHRDLKPGNVMLTKAGAKLLDFGLAKLSAADPELQGVSRLETRAKPLTTEGALLGTYQYMAPEQLEGKEADARTDVFALGTVLYEMATGTKAFHGTSQASLIGAILHTDPPLISTRQPMAPAALDRLVKSCLAKDPDERWQSSYDLVKELKWIGETASPLAATALPVAARPARRERWAWASIVGLLALSLGVVVLRSALRVTVNPIRLDLLTPKGVRLGDSVAISPDGRQLTFVATDGARTLLWVRSLDSVNSRPLAGTEGASYPFWSSNSRFIGFFAAGKLKKLDLSGGPPESLCDVAPGFGGTWSRDGVIVFAPVAAGGLSRVAASAGAVSPVTALNTARGETSHRWPSFLPDGHHFLFFAYGGHESRGIYLGSLDSRETTQVLATGQRGAYAPPGYLLFTLGNTLLARPFDLKSLRLGDESVSISEQVWYSIIRGHTSFSVSNEGTIVFRNGSDERHFAWYDREGRQVEQVGPSGRYDDGGWDLSPDGTRIAASRWDPETGRWDLWSMAPSGAGQTRQTFASTSNTDPIWSPDGTQIVFRCERDAGFDLCLKNVSGGEEKMLLESDNWTRPDAWSPDGRFIIYRKVDPKANFDLWLLPLSGERKPQPLVRTEFIEAQAQFSPDGHFFAYRSDASGRPEVYVQRFPPSDERWQVSTAGGWQPRWRRDGKELLYLAADRKLMAVDVRLGTVFQAGPPQALFQTNIQIVQGLSDSAQYLVSPDGSRFLLQEQGEGNDLRSIGVLLNWPAALQR